MGIDLFPVGTTIIKKDYMKKHRIYLVGAGVISSAHVAALEDLKNEGEFELRVCDLNPKALAAFVEKHPKVLPCASVDEMLGNSPRETDIVIICTPPMAHFELVQLALNSGRHVLCEKPLAMNQKQALEMLALARKKQKLFGCCSSRFVGTQMLREAKTLLKNKKLGSLYRIRWISRRNRGRSGIEYQPAARWFLDKSKNGGGTLMDWGPYDFTTLNHLLEPTQVEIVTAGNAMPHTNHELPPGTVQNVESHVWATIKYYLSDGTTLLVDFERASATHGQEYQCFEIEGTHGALALNWVDPCSFQHSWDEGGKVKTEKFTYSDVLSMHSRPIVNFFQAIQGKPSESITNEEAVFNFNCIRAVYDCAETSQSQRVDRRELCA
jgi:predicted dehydrogenase